MGKKIKRILGYIEGESFETFFLRKHGYTHLEHEDMRNKKYISEIDQI